MIASVLGLLTLVLAPLQDGEVTQRPPLGQHLRDIDEVSTAAGLVLDDEGNVWVLEQQLGRLLLIDADGSRQVLAEGLRSPRDLALGSEGRLFVSEAWSSSVSRLGPEGELELSFGSGLLHRPQGLDRVGDRVYVADRGRHRIEVFNQSGEHLFGFGGHGTEPGQFIEPHDVAVDSEGRIFVSDRGNSRLQVFSAEGEFLRSWGDWGPFPGLFSEPTGVVVQGERIYVADSGNHRVQVFDPKGELLDRFGLHAIRPREGVGFLHYPEALALSPDGELAALAEPVVDRVQLFCRTGGTPEDDVRRQAQGLARPSAHYGMDIEIAGPYLALSEPESHSVVFYVNSMSEPIRITRVSGLGTKTGLLSGVGGMDFEREARDLWVCDPSLRRLSLFRLRGSEEEEIGFDALKARFVKSVDLERLRELEMGAVLEAAPEPVALDRDGSGRFFIADRRNGCVVVLGSDLGFIEVVGAGVLAHPTGLAVSEDGERLYVADEASGVHCFAGKDWKHRALEAGGSGPWLAPYDLAIAPDGALFVTDSGNHTVTAFDAEGEWLRSWGGAGLERGQFYKPRGIALDQRGNLTVVDHANHRGQTFTPEGEYVGIFGLRLYTRLARYPHLKDKPADSGEGEE